MSPKILAFTHGGLSARERESVKRHIADCAICTEIAMNVGCVDRALSAAGPAVPGLHPAAAERMYQAALAALRPRRRRLLPMLVGAAAASASAAVLAVAIVFSRSVFLASLPVVDERLPSVPLASDPARATARIPIHTQSFAVVIPRPPVDPSPVKIVESAAVRKPQVHLPEPTTQIDVARESAPIAPAPIAPAWVDPPRLLVAVTHASEGSANGSGSKAPLQGEPSGYARAAVLRDDSGRPRIFECSIGRIGDRVVTERTTLAAPTFRQPAMLMCVAATRSNETDNETDKEQNP